MRSPITPTKYCKKCGEEFPRTAEYFAPDKRVRDGLQARCRSCQSAATADWDTRNPHKRSERLKRYYRSHVTEFHHRRHEHWLLSRDKHRIHMHLRRARLLKAGGSFTAAQIRKLYKLQKGKCWWQGPECTIDLGGRYHIDHRIPLSRGGSNDISNIVLSCPRCNLSKHDKMPSEFVGRLL